MEYSLESPIYEFAPNLLENIRKSYNLDEPGRMDEAVNILDSWIRKQQHFMKVDFPRRYLERCIINCKGSLEKAKKNIDSMCTLRMLMPHFYEDLDLRSKEFKKMFGILSVVILPKLTPDYHRIFILKCSIRQADKQSFTNFYKYSFSLFEYWRAHDYCNGFMAIIDYRDISIPDYMASVDLMDLQRASTMFVDGYKTRVKGIHILTDSTMIHMVVKLLKQGVSQKIKDRFHVHNNLEDLHKLMPKDLLPAEYGGNERSLEKLQDAWIEVLSSEEHVDYMKQMKKAVTNEAFRPKDSCNNEYLGLSGSFRTLRVD